MKFTETGILGTQIIEINRITDDRSFVARVWCQGEFTQRDLKAQSVQANVGHSVRSGTLRGIHYQRDPHPEAKVARCTRGAVYEVALDLWPTAPATCAGPASPWIPTTTPCSTSPKVAPTAIRL